MARLMKALKTFRSKPLNNNQPSRLGCSNNSLGRFIVVTKRVLLHRRYIVPELKLSPLSSLHM